MRSALHRWSPAINDAKAAYIDKRKETFACAIGSKKKESEEEEEKKTIEVAPIDHKAEIVGELTKLMNMYKAMGPQEKGKVMGY